MVHRGQLVECSARYRAQVAGLFVAAIGLSGCSLLFTEASSDAGAQNTGIDIGDSFFETMEDVNEVRFMFEVDQAENRLLLVAATTSSASYYTATVTFGGVEMTQVGETIVTDAIDAAEEDCTSTLWYAKSPLVGSFELVAALDDPSRVRSISVIAVSLSGVDQGDPVRDDAIKFSEIPVTESTATVASEAAQLVVDSLCHGESPAVLSPDSPQQLIAIGPNADGNVQTAVSAKASEPTATTMSWTHSLATNAHIAVAIRPAP